MENRVVAITMVKNEADIIESFVRHTLSFADMLWIVDHQSTDETGKILQHLKDEGLPIRIELHNEVGYAQSEIMTDIMNRAFRDENADLVIPLDADEFLVENDGNHLRLCNILRNLYTDAIYGISGFCYSILEPDEAVDQFLLSRPLQKCTGETSEYHKIIAVGIKVAESKALKLSQGNHYMMVNDGEDWHTSEEYNLHIAHLAHFPNRSEEQLRSKVLCGWLTNLACYTRDTNTASHWRKGFESCLSGKHLFNVQKICNGAEHSWSYADEYTLSYTSGKMDSFANAIRTAAQIADEFARFKLLNNKKWISVLLVFDGNLQSCMKSLESIKKLTYPYCEIFVIVLNSENIFAVKNYLRHFPKQVILLEVEFFSKLSEVVHGDYIQWVQPGDTLFRNRLERMVVVMEAHEDIDIVLSMAEHEGEDEAKTGNFCPDCLSLPEENSILFFDSRRILLLLLTDGLIINGELSSGLFRRSVLEATGWFAEEFVGASPFMLSIWAKAFNGRHIALLNEVLLSPQNQIWNADEYILYMMEWFYQIQQKRASGFLSIDAYEKAKANFCYLREKVHERLSLYASPELFKEFIDVDFDYSRD